jgi:hypothetical protein
MAIGNQWTDPNTQILTHAAQAFYLGLVNEAQSEHLLGLAHEAIAKNLVPQVNILPNVKEGDTVGALESRLKMFDKYNEYTGKGNFVQFKC